MIKNVSRVIIIKAVKCLPIGVNFRTRVLVRYSMSHIIKRARNIYYD
jgi:hypothetical protein